MHVYTEIMSQHHEIFENPRTGYTSVCQTGDGDALVGGENLDIIAPSSVSSSIPSVPTPKVLEDAYTLTVETSQSKGIVSTIHWHIICLWV